jgi:hypothetical protein
MNLKSSWDVAGPFAPHGEFTLTSVGEILCYEAAGPFNIETLQAPDHTHQSLRKMAGQRHLRRHRALASQCLDVVEAFDAYRDGCSSSLSPPTQGR